MRRFLLFISVMLLSVAIWADETIDYTTYAKSLRGQVYTEFLELLSDYQEHKQGWDGEDALPLSSQVVKNFKKVLQKSDDSQLIGWTIYPAANGTLLLQNKERKSGINIGVSGFSYYYIENGEAKGENHLKFSPQAILNTMKTI